MSTCLFSIRAREFEILGKYIAATSTTTPEEYYWSHAFAAARSSRGRPHSLTSTVNYQLQTIHIKRQNSLPPVPMFEPQRLKFGLCPSFEPLAGGLAENCWRIATTLSVFCCLVWYTCTTPVLAPMIPAISPIIASTPDMIFGEGELSDCFTSNGGRRKHVM